MSWTHLKFVCALRVCHVNCMVFVVRTIFLLFGNFVAMRLDGVVDTLTVTYTHSPLPPKNACSPRAAPGRQRWSCNYGWAKLTLAVNQRTIQNNFFSSVSETRPKFIWILSAAVVNSHEWDANVKNQLIRFTLPKYERVSNSTTVYPTQKT